MNDFLYVCVVFISFCFCDPAFSYVTLASLKLAIPPPLPIPESAGNIGIEPSPLFFICITILLIKYS